MYNHVKTLKFFLLPQKIEHNTILLHFFFSTKILLMVQKIFSPKNIPILLHIQHFSILKHFKIEQVHCRTLLVTFVENELSLEP